MSAAVLTSTQETSVIGKDRDYISFSSIRAYQACPLRYFFRYVAGLPEESVVATLVFGTAIHRAIEHHFRELLADNAPPSIDALIDHYSAGWQERAGVREWCHVDPLSVEQTKRVRERVWPTIAAGLFYPAPSPMNCPGCPFRGPWHNWRG